MVVQTVDISEQRLMRHISLRDALPPLTEGARATLKHLIEEQGLLEPILRWRGQIVDGYERLAICAELGIEPAFHEIMFQDYGEALRYRIESHAEERHLEPVQLAFLAVGCWEAYAQVSTDRMRSGVKAGDGQTGKTAECLARLFGISTRLVEIVRRVRSLNLPSLSDALRDERISPHSANEICGLPKEVRLEVLDLLLAEKGRTVAEARALVFRKASSAPISSGGGGASGRAFRTVKANSVDMVWINEISAEVQSGTRLAREIPKVLKQGGSLLVVVPFDRSPDPVALLPNSDKFIAEEELEDDDATTEGKRTKPGMVYRGLLSVRMGAATPLAVLWFVKEKHRHRWQVIRNDLDIETLLADLTPKKGSILEYSGRRLIQCASRPGLKYISIASGSLEVGSPNEAFSLVPKEGGRTGQTRTAKAISAGALQSRRSAVEYGPAAEHLLAGTNRRVALVDSAPVERPKIGYTIECVRRALRAKAFRWRDKIDSSFGVLAYSVLTAENSVNVLASLRRNGIPIFKTQRHNGPKIVVGGAAVANLPWLKEIADEVFIGEIDGCKVGKRWTCDPLNSVPVSRQRSSYVELTRGCARSCGFCEYSHLLGGPYREKDIELVKQQIRELRDLGARRFNLLSANWASYGELEELLRFLRQKGDQITNQDCALEDIHRIYPLIADGTVPIVKVGVESFHEPTRRMLGKRVSDERLRGMLRFLIGKCSTVHMYLIHGASGDDYETWFEMLRFIYDLRIKADYPAGVKFTVTPFEPAPGTPMAKAQLASADSERDFAPRWFGALRYFGFSEFDPENPVRMDFGRPPELRRLVYLLKRVSHPAFADALLRAFPAGTEALNTSPESLNITISRLESDFPLF